MHPEISAIPKLITYPELHDAPHVSNQPAVKGLQGRVIFVDHNQPEDQRDKLANKDESVSKTNQHEIGMVVAPIRYLLQQGYTPSDLVVLTPYLGQLLKLQDALVFEAIAGQAVNRDVYTRGYRRQLSGRRGEYRHHLACPQQL